MADRHKVILYAQIYTNDIETIDKKFLRGGLSFPPSLPVAFLRRRERVHNLTITTDGISKWGIIFLATSFRK